MVYPPNCSLWNWYTVGEAGICEEPDSSTKEGDSPVQVLAKLTYMYIFSRVELFENAALIQVIDFI